MNDLISRKQAIDAINSHFGFNTEEEYGSAVQEVINGLPAVQPERKKGKWINDIERFGDNSYHCSQCGAVLEKDDLEWRNNYYCYHCGLDMRGE